MRNAIIPALMILLAGLSSARASGGTWCDIDDQNLKFHIHVAYPRAGGQPIGFESSLQVFSTTAPKEFQAFRFKEADLVESRSDGRPGGSLKMRLVRRGTAKEAFGEVRLVIDAPAVDEAIFKGRYDLTIHPRKSAAAKDPFRASGSVSCSGD